MVNAQNIPEPLRELDQWLLWRRQVRGGDKPTKVPYSAHGGMGKSSDPSTWASFGRVMREYDLGDYSGIGFAMAPGDGLVGIDLDHCLDEKGMPTPEAMGILERFQDCSYIEVSPSGEGLRLFTYGEAIRCGKGRDDFKWIEVYDHTSPRYLTVTGNVLFGNPRPIGDGQEALDWLHETYMHKPEEPKPLPPRVASVGVVELNDRQIIERIERSRAASEWHSLYQRGDLSGHGNDHSAADLALCNMLAFWFGCDIRRMDSVFRSSALMRKKWDRNAGQRRTYGELTLAKAIAGCHEVYEPRAPVSVPRSPSKPGEDPPLGNDADDGWKETLLRGRANRDGFRPIRSVGVNIVKILTHDRRWRGVLAFDEFQNRPVFLQKPLFSEEYDIDFEPGMTIEELDIDRITYWFGEFWGLIVSPDTTIKAVQTVAQQNSFHPVRDYLESLEWDGVGRIDNWLSTYLWAKYENEEQLEYIRLVGKWWLLSAVARIFHPGAKADYVLVLEGHEGIRKSSALRVLAGDWFTDAAIDLNNKDAYLQITGAWVVEIAELDALMKTESSTAKAFFTRCSDKYRPPYGRNAVEVARQCVCAGTVNHNDYIKDYTGGRRYWPVWCVKVELEQLAKDRDQIWAEAVHCYREGHRYWPEGKHQRDLCAAEQQARQIDDPWEASIVYWLAGRTWVTTGDLLEGAIGMDRDKWNRGHQTRIGQIMTRLGWKRERKRIDGTPQTYYTPPSGDDDA